MQLRGEANVSAHQVALMRFGIDEERHLGAITRGARLDQARLRKSRQVNVDLRHRLYQEEAVRVAEIGLVAIAADEVNRQVGVALLIAARHHAGRDLAHNSLAGLARRHGISGFVNHYATTRSLPAGEIGLDPRFGVAGIVRADFRELRNRPDNQQVLVILR